MLSCLAAGLGAGLPVLLLPPLSGVLPGCWLPLVHAFKGFEGSKDTADP